MRRRVAWVAGTILVLVALIVVAIGPDIVWQLARHGTTTVWDHLEYPTRALEPSSDPSPWPTAAGAADLPAVPPDLEATLLATDTLAFLVVRDGAVVGEWYGDDGGPAVRSMLFSVSKSIVSLLIGAAVDDGWIGAVTDPVTDYVPELAATGFDDVSIEDLLRMDSGMDYVEDDNPFGLHIPFNYTTDLRAMILDLEVRDEPDPGFRYKSGDNALAALVLERALGGPTLTDYLQERLWDPLGATERGSWNLDREGGFERSWCCLAMTARDLARFGQLVLQAGRWDGAQLVSEGWLERSFTPGFLGERWPDGYADSPIDNYGYQWWLLQNGARLALGKDGQYLYVDPEHDVVIVRLGESPGDAAWIEIMQTVASAPAP